MLYRPYGATGARVSVIGFGGMRFRTPDDLETSAQLVLAAYEQGINFFDTAPGYRRSEDIFGAAFREIRRRRKSLPFYVSTKTHKSRPEDVRRDLETSLRRLELDTIDFYHVWCVLTPEDYAQRKPALRELERLRDEGLIRHICVSTHMAGPDIRAMLADYPFEGLLVGYSVMNFAFREEALDAAAERGIGVAVMNPLGGGLIPQNPQYFDFVRTRPDETVVEGALRFLISDPRVTVALVGFSTLEELEPAVRVTTAFHPLASGEIARLRTGLRTAFQALCTGCRYCEPCETGVPVSRLMEAYNHVPLTGRRSAVISRLRMHWDIQPDDKRLRSCTECGACEARCTQRLPIRERLRQIRNEAEQWIAEHRPPS